ncbi:MAG: hypothetical protein R6U38_13410 [Desulfatiglandaceae bacterium]
MGFKKRNQTASPRLQKKLSALENQAAERGIQIHYDVLEAAGLKLKGGVCCVNGEYHIFVDRRKSLAERVHFLETHLQQPLDETTSLSDDPISPFNGRK